MTNALEQYVRDQCKHDPQHDLAQCSSCSRTLPTCWLDGTRCRCCVPAPAGPEYVRPVIVVQRRSSLTRRLLLRLLRKVLR